MATRISQEQLNKFINPEAAMAPYQRAQQSAESSKAQDAALRQLIRGKELDESAAVAGDTRQAQTKQAAIDANVQRARAEAARGGMQPGKYSINAGEGSFGVNPEQDGLGRQIAQGLRAANITGFDITDPENVMPSRQDAEKVKAAAAVVKQAQGELPGTRQALRKSGPLDRFGSMNIGPVSIGSEAGRDLEQRKTALLSYAQKLADTGVLQPGELPLLNRRVGELTGIGSMLRNPADIEKQLNELETQLINKTQADATARGYTPRGDYLAPSTGMQPKGGQAPDPSQDAGFQAWKKSRGL